MPTTEPYVLSRRLLAESRRRDGLAEDPPGSNSGPYVSRVMRKTSYGKDGPWCAAHVEDVADTVLTENGGHGFPCDSAAAETLSSWLTAAGWLWRGDLDDLPPGAIVCQGGRHTTFFAGWISPGASYVGHGGNQSDRVKASTYRLTTDTRFYVVPDSYDRELVPPKPKPLYEAIRGEGERTVRVVHRAHLDDALRSVRAALKGGAKRVVIRRLPPEGR